MLTTAVTITLPDLPEEGVDNVFVYYRWYIRGLLNPAPSSGFKVRLFVLFGLTG
jgi:hypothetical protein